MLRKTLFTLGCAAASLGFSGAASAATIVFDLNPPSGTFQSAGNVSCDAGPAGCAGDFTANGTFAAPAGYNLVGGTITTGPGAGATDINFGSAFLNGVEFTLTALGDPAGTFEFGFVNPVALQALNTIELAGYTGGAASFSGTLTFTSGAVPEPATWALMILGFGAVGIGLRRRQRQNVSAKLNFA